MRNPLLLFFMLMASVAFGQTTGSFDTTLNFMTANRTLSIHVPTSYSSSTPAKLMICLHGLGDNSTNYRNALINSLGWNTHFPNTIFVCPAASTPNSDFYLPAGYEDIVDASVQMIKQVYTIDTTEIILQGFSLGGRAALKYGLDHPTDFNGLLLNTPAVQGVKNALNGIPGFTFNYANASQIPIYITHGETDYLYTAAIDSTMEKLILNNAPARFIRVTGLGHAIPAFTQMPGLASFFSTPESAGPDAELFRLQVPGQSCQPSAQTKALLRNTGNTALNAAQFQVNYNGNPQTYSWSGNLQPFEHAWINLPMLTLSAGKKMLDVSIQTVNGVNDTFPMNNQRIDSITAFTGGLPLPQSEGFESGTFPPAGWMAERYNEDWTYFDFDDQVKKSGNYSTYAFNSIFIFDNQGRKAEMVTPPVQLNLSATPSVSFDYAFNYVRYTPPYFTAQTDFTDTLEILVSTNCGQSFQSIFKKWGPQLATFANPTLNPLDIPSVFINPKDSNWKRIELDLAPYASATEAMIKFSYISGLGGNINIDNILFNNIPLSTSSQELDASIQVYPNPAHRQVSIRHIPNNLQGRQISLHEVSGKSILQKNIPDAQEEYVLELPELTPGVYVLRVGQFVKQIIIE